MTHTDVQTEYGCGQKPEKILTPKELSGYRQWLAELDAESREDGGCCGDCPEDLWDIFDPQGAAGRQICSSFTQEELFEIILASEQRNGTPKLNDIYYVYRHYIKQRFGGWVKALPLARDYKVFKQTISKWPAGWYQNVSVEPLLEHLTKRGIDPDPAVVGIFEGWCREVRRTGCPPVISISLRKRINTVYNCSAALELMGIPSLIKAEMKPVKEKLLAHWAEEYRSLQRQGR